jgi:hypothetical protein
VILRKREQGQKSIPKTIGGNKRLGRGEKQVLESSSHGFDGNLQESQKLIGYLKRKGVNFH